MIQLTPFFTLVELTVTSTGLPNEPFPDAVWHLRMLCSAVLVPWRERVGPLKITSGFRSEAVNKAVGGVADSHHLTGEGADVKPLSVSLDDAWDVLVQVMTAGLPVDQAIRYARHIHVSHTHSRVNRRQVLYA